MLIYLLTNISNGKVYIGQTTKPLTVRLRGHRSEARSLRKSQPIHHAIAKYGWDNFTAEILEECEEADLDMSERFWIRTYNSLAPNGYNLDSGGSSQKRRSEDTKQKLRVANLGRKQTAEACERRSESLRGRTRTPAECAAISAGRKGLKPTEEARANMSASQRRKAPASAATRAKMSLGRRGELGNNCRLSWEIVRKIRTECANGRSQKEVGLEHGLHQGTVSNIVRNKTWVEDPKE